MINVTYRRKDLSANLYKKEPYKTRSRPLFGGLLNDVYRALQAAGDGTQMWSGFAEVGVDEGDLFGGEEALGLLVAGGEEGLMELLAIGHHLHEVAHGITGVALWEIGESEFGLGKHGIQ